MDNKAVFPADILWVSNEIYSERYHIKPHAHIAYGHMVYVKSGNCRAVLNNKAYDLAEGMLMIAMPEDVHSLDPIPIGKEARIVDIKFLLHSQLLEAALKKLDRVFTLDVLEKGLIEEILQNGLGAIHVNANRIYLSSLFYHICAEALNNCTDDEGSRCLQGIDISNFSRATIETVHYIEENYMNEISLEQIGSAIGYYKNYISTAVKRDLGITVNELLMFVRIQKAAELLFYSDYSIKQIYTQTGFKNINHFTRIFKKMVGVPPAQYRRSFPDDVFVAGDEVSNIDGAVPIWVRSMLRDYIESISH